MRLRNYYDYCNTAYIIYYKENTDVYLDIPLAGSWMGSGEATTQTRHSDIGYALQYKYGHTK